MRDRTRFVPTSPSPPCGGGRCRVGTGEVLRVAREVVATLDGLHSFRELEAEGRWRESTTARA